MTARSVAQPHTKSRFLKPALIRRRCTESDAVPASQKVGLPFPNNGQEAFADFACSRINFELLKT